MLDIKCSNNRTSQILDVFHRLNDRGKDCLLSYGEDIIGIKKYTARATAARVVSMPLKRTEQPVKQK